MFTGLVADVGEVEAADHGDGGLRIRIGTGLAAEIAAGDSVAVSGVCLTAASVGDGAFEADVSPQTLSVSNLGSLGAGGKVNLELALRLSDRLGGHLVQGHVDGPGEVAAAEPEGSGTRLRVTVPPDVGRYIVERGSIAVDGVSLTVATLNGDAFDAALIPETLARTTLGEARPGDAVNLECDLLARYVERLIDHHSGETDPDGR